MQSIFILSVSFLSFLFGIIDCGYRVPDTKPKAVVTEWEMNKQHINEELAKEIKFALHSQGHGHTGQKSMEECPSVCTYELNPVCGSDGVTYDNKCLLAFKACREQKRLFVEKQGKC